MSRAACPARSFVITIITCFDRRNTRRAFFVPKQPEAFSRILIDQALRDSGWDLLDPYQVRFEMSGRDGRADYVLGGRQGPVCVLEAKREDLDPYDAKEQARGYAENLRAPFIILSNGREHWFWNYQRADQQDAYRIERLPSPRDLERLRLKNLQPPRPLMTEPVGPGYLRPFKQDIRVRRYQINAIDEVSRQFDEGWKAQVPARNGNRHRQDASLRGADPPLSVHAKR